MQNTERYSMSTYTGVTNFQKHPVFGPPCISGIFEYWTSRKSFPSFHKLRCQDLRIVNKSDANYGCI